MKKTALLSLLLFLLLPRVISAALPGAADPSPCNGLEPTPKARCETCMGSDPASTTGRVWTALGCLNAGTPVGVQGSLIGQILVWSTVVGGGIAFLIIAFAGIQLATAAGDPKRVKSAQELIWAAISGLLLIVFSILILNLIGFRILNLGGLGLPPPAP